MESKAGKGLPQTAQNAEILNDDRIQSRLVKGLYIIAQLLQLLFLQQRVYREINFSSQQMSVADAFHKLFCGKIFRIGSCAEAAARQINGVGACVDGAVKGGRAACRSQKLRFFPVFHIDTYMQKKSCPCGQPTFIFSLTLFPIAQYSLRFHSDPAAEI